MTEEIVQPVKASDEFRVADKLYMSGVHYDLDDIGSFIQVGVLGFVGIGFADDNLQYVLDGLEAIEGRSVLHPTLITPEQATFGSTGAETFFSFWASNAELLEPGLVTSASLNEDGKKLLALLREWKVHYDTRREAVMGHQA